MPNTIRKFILSENSENEISEHVFEYEVDADWLAEIEIFPGWHQYNGYFRILDLDEEVIAENEIVAGSSVSKESSNGRSSGYTCITTIRLIGWVGAHPDYMGARYETITTCFSSRGGNQGNETSQGDSENIGVEMGPTDIPIDGNGGGSDFPPLNTCSTNSIKNESGACVCRDGYVRNGSGGCVQQTELEKIMKCEELSDVQLNQLGSVLAEYLSNCLNIQVFGYINDNQKKFCFKIGSTSGEQGSYNYTNSDFSFADTEAINSTVFGEELYHAYQDLYYGGLSQFNNIGRSNIEFEAKLYHDLTHNGICCLVFSNSTVQTEYLLWLIEITDDFQRMPNWSELTQYYFHYLEQFIIDKPDYNYPIDYNMTPNALLNLNNC